jgi:hypothetical protein
VGHHEHDAPGLAQQLLVQGARLEADLREDLVPGLWTGDAQSFDEREEEVARRRARDARPLLGGAFRPVDQLQVAP